MLVRMLVSLFLLCVLIPSAVCNQCSSRSNGCSIPYNLPYLYKDRFTPSCDKHDVCYSCGLKFGMSRSSCDIKLYSDARQSCSSISNSLQREFCRAVAFDYFSGVTAGGWLFYNYGSAPSWCSESWVSQCLP